MDLERLPLEGLVLIKPRVFADERGFFKETFRQRDYREAGIDLPFVQDNLSRSTYSTLRGLHFQPRQPQGKLVSVIRGRVFDVAVDIRVGSPTFMKWHGLVLDDENHWQFYISPGFAHGFVVLSEVADFHYKCTDYYRPDDQGHIRWNDPDINIDWPIQEPTLSPKDANAPSLRDLFAG